MIEEGRVAIVTGGGSGIGRETAIALAKNGAKVAVVDLDPDRATETLRDIDKLGGWALALEGDVSDPDDIQRVVDRVLEKYSRIDILVHCAGVLIDGTIKKLQSSTWDKVVNINLRGTFLMVQAVMAAMSEREYGRIVTLASGAYLGNFGQAAYAASKAGVVAFSKTAALEGARKHITVNCVAPGLVRTPMTEGMPEEALAKLEKTIPVGRIGEPQDIAHMILSLVADEASYVTGQVIHVDGGATTGM